MVQEGVTAAKFFVPEMLDEIVIGVVCHFEVFFIP